MICFCRYQEECVAMFSWHVFRHVASPVLSQLSLMVSIGELKRCQLSWIRHNAQNGHEAKMLFLAFVQKCRGL